MSDTGVPTVGVIGGGQLARMMHEAATPLGIGFRLLAEGPDVSAAKVVPETTVGDYRDLETLRAFAAGCDVVTFDHEHVPSEHIRALEADGVVVRPSASSLTYAQDKAEMRERLAGLGIPVPPFRVVRTPSDVDELPVVLKAIRGGYDGHGVWVVESRDDLAEPFRAAGGDPLLLEAKVPFTRELSAVVARSPSGQAIAYPIVESVQREGKCHEVLAPAPDLPESKALQAQRIALRIAGELDVTGILAVELFETSEPDGLLVNELAMRPHNTGHWSIDGAVTSQFENHLRAVLDLPLGSPHPRAGWTVMVNVLGGDYPDLHKAFLHCMARDPALRIHLYGKEVRPGRKVGHVTTYGGTLGSVLERARHAAAYLTGEIDE